MKWALLAAAVAAAWPYVAIAKAVPKSARSGDGLAVWTTSGTVKGIIDESNPNVRQFLGIPYAQPPLGDLRFAPPQPLPESARNRIVQATKLPPSCLQYLGTAPSVYTRNVLQFNLQGLNKTGSISEDCLTLSVWTPTIDKNDGCDPAGEKLLPVLIFIYGGGFSTGGEDVPYQIPTQWVQRTRDHLVVSFNYRVNFFGYPNARGLSGSASNPGLLDQRAAVEWVRDNIARFGGDPKRMALWGQSAGSQSVDFYSFSHPDDPIVSGLIMDSGTAQSRFTSSSVSYSSFSYVAAQFGCGNLTSDGAAELACVKKVDGAAIEAFIANHSNSGASPGLSFGPVADNITVFYNSTERALQGKMARIPAIIGTNAQDGVPFVPYNPAGPNETAALIAGLYAFFCPATETSYLRQLGGFTTYRYYYGGNFSNISPTDWLGAYHSAELPLLMGTYGNFRGPGTELEKETSKVYQDAYVAFAAGNVERTGWEKYEHLGQATVRNFGNATGGPVKDISVSWLEKMCDGAKVAGFSQ